MNRRELLKNTAILMGGLSSASVVSAFMAGANVQSKILNLVFSDWEREVTTVVAEMIIPRTDTPGAIEAGVPHFIELMVSDWYTSLERSIYLEGLVLLDEYCKKTFGSDFIQSTQRQKTLALEHAEEQSEKYKTVKPKSPLSKEEDENKPFFIKVKELTVLGYYSSETGATQELKYDPMPMRYGDIDLVDVGRQWSS